MAVSNCYTTLAKMSAIKRISSVNAVEDAVLEAMISAASRVIDGYCGRTFYPRVANRLYDVPENILFLKDDLLSLTTLTNGDATVITSTDYILESSGRYPYWGIKLRDISSVFWLYNSYGSEERVISVLGEWGYHNDYPGAWFATDTLSAGVNAAVTALPTTGSALLKQNQIIKIDSEVMNVSSVVTTTTNVTKRGDNGSTAAAHLISAQIYVWLPIEDIRAACEDIVLTEYNKRFGAGQEAGVVTVTAAGVVISPSDMSAYAKGILDRYRRNF